MKAKRPDSTGACAAERSSIQPICGPIQRKRSTLKPAVHTAELESTERRAGGSHPLASAPAMPPQCRSPHPAASQRGPRGPHACLLAHVCPPEYVAALLPLYVLPFLEGSQTENPGRVRMQTWKQRASGGNHNRSSRVSLRPEPERAPQGLQADDAQRLGALWMVMTL